MSFTYLWHHEHAGGREEGEKDRPSVIVLAVEREAEGATVVTVLPITHNPPADLASAVEIRCRSSGILGSTLTDPGSSSPLRFTQVAAQHRYDDGFLPPRFFNQMLKAFLG